MGNLPRGRLDQRAGYRQLIAAVNTIAVRAQSEKDQMAAGDYSAVRLGEMHDWLININDAYDAVTAIFTPAQMNAYISTREPDFNGDIEGAWQALEAAGTVVVQEIRTLIRDVSGNVAMHRVTGASRIVDRTFTPAETASVRTALDGIIAAVS